MRAVSALSIPTPKSMSIGILAVLTLLLSFAISSNTEAQALRYVEGTHYQLVPNPVAPKNTDKIEITEIFWYGCPHCYQFQPQMTQWIKQLPEDVEVKHLPAMWNRPMLTHARLFYTAKALGLEKKMHAVFFNAMHVEKKRLINDKQIFELFEKEGVSKEKFDKVFNAFGIKSQVQQASALAKSYGMTGTPEVVVNGKYRITAGMAGSQGGMIEVANYLINKERLAKKS